MRPSSFFARSLMAGAIALTGAVSATSGAFAQATGTGAETLTSELTGWDVEIVGDYFELEETVVENYAHGDGERFYFNGLDSTAFAELSFFDDSDTPQGTIDIMAGDFEEQMTAYDVLDEGNEGDAYFQFASFEDDGITGYYYIEVIEDVDGNTDMMQMMYGLDSTFVDDWSNAQEDIIVDGEGFLSAPAVGDFQDVIDGGGATDDDADADADATAESDSSGTRGSLRGDTNTSETGTRTTRGTTETTETTEATTEATGETSFEFTVYPATLETSGPVVITDTSEDSVSEIVQMESDGISFAMVGYVEDSGTASEAMDLFIDGASGSAESVEELDRIDEADFAYGVYRMDLGMPLIMVIQITEVDNGVFLLELVSMMEEDVETEFVTYQDNVLIDGDVIFPDTDVQDILDVL